MKAEDISEAMNNINEDFLESANNIRKKKNKNLKWLKYAGAAAAAFIIVFAGITHNPGKPPLEDGENNPTQNPLEDDPDVGGTQYGGPLPQLVFEESDGFAYGFEGYLAYDISELDNGNPWNEKMVFETLPVFENTSFHPTGLVNPGIGEKAMFEKIEFSAHALDAKINEVVKKTIGDTTEGTDIPPEVLTVVYAYSDACTIEVSGNGTITAHFGYDKKVYREGIELPDKYSFTYNKTSDGEAFETIKYIYENYGDFIGLDEATFVTSGDYTFDGEFSRNYRIYDFSGDEISDMLNFAFSEIQLAPNDEGKLMLIRINDKLSCAEKIGDYPIISIDEATDMLLEGSYITTVPFDMPGKKYISKVELIYRSGTNENIWMPYYRFLVELPDDGMNYAEGLKNFGAYYVPAVELDYISGLELWNGSFN